MKRIVLAIFMLSLCANASQFGEYKYSKYLGIQQQLRTQQMAAARRQRLYNQNPTRNIRYQRYSGEYPNIEHNYSRNLGVSRYSSQYYQMKYGI